MEERPTAATRGGGRKTVVEMLVVGTLASIAGIAIGVWIDWFPMQGSTQSEPIDTLWDVLVIVSVPIFVLVTVVVLYAVRDFRLRPGEENLDGPPIHGSTRLEVIWTAVPAVLLVALCTYAYVVLVDIEEAPADPAAERQVTVVGEQFAWTFEYEEGGQRFTTNQLFVPEGESVRFNVRSKDVIHDFWVPDWRMKIDAVPGITTKIRVTPTALGQHEIVCAELCGIGHAFMRQTATVVSAGEFDEWVQRQVREGSDPPAAGAGDTSGGREGGGGASDDPGEAPGETAEVDGRTLFLEGNAAGATACGLCHTLADAGTSSETGPDLDEALAGRDEAFIRRAILDPDAEIAEGFGRSIMPSSYDELLSEGQLDALVSYLAEVTK